MVFFIIAYRNIIQRRVRSLMLFVAIVGVAFVFSFLLALVQGVKNSMIRNGTALSTGHLNIAGFYKISQSSANPLVTKYPVLKQFAKTEIPEARMVIDRVKAFGKVITETDSAQIPMWGVNMDEESEALAKLETVVPQKGQLQSDIGQLKYKGGIALFEVHAKKLGVGVGDMVTVSIPTYRNMSNTKDLKVVAVLKDLGMFSQFNAYMNADDVREIYQNKPDSTGQIMIYLKNLGDMPAVEERLRKVLAEKGYNLMDKDEKPFWMKFDRVAGESWTGQRLDVTTWEDETSFLKWIVSLLSALAWMLTLVLSAIIVMGLINALWMAVKERTTEIGTLRAIGMQRGKVLWMFLLESMILSISGTILGLALSAICCGLLNLARIPVESDAYQLIMMTNHVEFAFTPALALTSFLFLVILFTLGSLIPAYQATRLSPIIAMSQA